MCVCLYTFLLNHLENPRVFLYSRWARRENLAGTAHAQEWKSRNVDSTGVHFCTNIANIYFQFRMCIFCICLYHICTLHYIYTLCPNASTCCTKNVFHTIMYHIMWWKCLLWNVHMHVHLREKIKGVQYLRLRFQGCKSVRDCIFTACAPLCAPRSAPGSGAALWSLLLELEIHSKPTFLSSFWINLKFVTDDFWFFFQISQAWCLQYVAWPNLFPRAPFKATKDLNLSMYTYTPKSDKHLKLEPEITFVYSLL